MKIMYEGRVLFYCHCTCTPCKSDMHVFCNFMCNDAKWRQSPSLESVFWEGCYQNHDPRLLQPTSILTKEKLNASKND